MFLKRLSLCEIWAVIETMSEPALWCGFAHYIDKIWFSFKLRSFRCNKLRVGCRILASWAEVYWQPAHDRGRIVSKSTPHVCFMYCPTV